MAFLADVFLNSKVIATDRNGVGNVEVLIQSPQGVKLILAKKLLISIPPLVSNLAGFDLSTTERNLFAQWSNGAYYTALLRNTGIPDNVDVVGVGAGTAYNLPTCKHSHFPPPTLFHTLYPSRNTADTASCPLPTVPAPYNIAPTALTGLKDIKYGATSALPSDAAVKAAIIADIARFKTANGFTSASPSEPEFVAYNSHTPYELRVSTQAIEAGFYGNLTALQGVRNTYWTGAAFDKHDSGDLWAFTEGLLGGIVK